MESRRTSSRDAARSRPVECGVKGEVEKSGTLSCAAWRMAADRLAGNDVGQEIRCERCSRS